ncbi:hypothetical protein FAM19031_000578 [Propionibacterium freudenreichii]|uniref:hypothetical protein n=1 Tax=Propionibacterium freudenreichii TaxID=1744 RepID=UPI002434514C|nr:hypothetical protein [Propionibacterium freudenreichii]MDK9294540.1 hypothetical protein [Propionibacterium freudenreichii]MDK9359869.1 hypothetical protein [Propionibacterium freudenreichii]MDK9657902.1 hypothetical protein [Propionibacterium freudenreichii]WFF31055.1 hypothetical protein FAM19024_000243 [Propionibacterium freudenreichii]
MSAPERRDGTVTVGAEMWALLLETQLAATQLLDLVAAPDSRVLAPMADLEDTLVRVAKAARAFEEFMADGIGGEGR